MTTEEVKLKYAQEPWGKLLIEIGWSPYDTESSARFVAAYAAKKLEEKDTEIARLQEAYASTVDAWMERMAAEVE